MKLLKYGFAVALLGTASHSFAQYRQDALRFSQSQPVGTARTLGIGGATAAVGGDYGSVSVNPAGLGMFQRSEFSLSPGFTSIRSDARAFGTRSNDSRSNLHLGSAGFVFTNRRPDGDGSPWRAGSFALGLTRTASYNQSFRYEGQPEAREDIFQRLGEDQRSGLDDLAYNTYLTDSIAKDKPRFLSDPFVNTGKLRQGESVRTSGSNTQFDAAYGASYLDKLYVGGGIGITIAHYNSESILTAEALNSNDPNSAFQSLRLRESLDTRGAGINARLGIIYRPHDALRIGASVQTPTYYQFTEQFNNSLQANFSRPISVGSQTFASASDAPEYQPFDYALTTPFKATGGVALVLGKYGFVSGDVEYLNYSSAHLSNYDNNGIKGNANFSKDNDAIRDLYQSAVNLRFGAEGRFDIFRARLGFAHYGDPYKEANVTQRRTYYTVGLGLRQNNFFFDAAGVYNTGSSLHSPYRISDIQNGRTPVVEVDNRNFTTTLTAGFIF